MAALRSHENDIFRGGTFISVTGSCTHEMRFRGVQALFGGGFELS
jgi:hypothetical protein